MNRIWMVMVVLSGVSGWLCAAEEEIISSETDAQGRQFVYAISQVDAAELQPYTFESGADFPLSPGNAVRLAKKSLQTDIPSAVELRVVSVTLRSLKHQKWVYLIYFQCFDGNHTYLTDINSQVVLDSNGRIIHRRPLPSNDVPQPPIGADAHVQACWMFEHGDSLPSSTMKAIADRVKCHSAGRSENLDGVSCPPGDPAMIVTWDSSTGMWQSLDSGTTLVMKSDRTSDQHPSCHSGDWTADGKTLFIGRTSRNIGEVCSVDATGITTMEWPISPWDGDWLEPVRSSANPPWYAYQKVMSSDGGIFLARCDHELGSPSTIYSSRDRGATWMKCGSVPTVVSICPTDHGCLLFASGKGYNGENVSADCGKTWTTISSPMRHDFSSGNPPYCRTNDRVYILNNRDLYQISFRGELLAVSTIDPLFQFHNGQSRVNAIAVDQRDPRIIYMTGDHIGLVRSLDGGTTWRAMPLPRNPGQTRPRYINDSIALTAGSTPRVAVVSENHLWVIDDSGHPDDLFPYDLPMDIDRNPAEHP